MRDARFELIGLGECMVELRAEQALGPAPALTRSFGGDVLNALVTAARLGARTGFVTRVGADPFGAALHASWAEEGIDLACTPLVKGENGVYFIALDAAGEHEFSCRRHDSSSSRIGPGDIDEAYIASASCLLVSGITQAISSNAQAATLMACRMARRHGVLVAYAPNYRPALWAWRGAIEGARRAMEEILMLVDIVLPSDPSDAALLRDKPASAGEAALQFGRMVPEVAQKCGAGGATVVVGENCETVPPALARSVIDTTGAGDAWNGAYLFHRVRGDGPAVAAAAANALVAAKLAQRGAISARDHTNGGW